MNMPRINVWASLNTEANLDRIARQARDVVQSADRQKRLAADLKVKAQKGDRAAERALAMLVDSSYESHAEAELEAKS
jgi:hypothetical protein